MAKARPNERRTLSIKRVHAALRPPPNNAVYGRDFGATMACSNSWQGACDEKFTRDVLRLAGAHWPGGGRLGIVAVAPQMIAPRRSDPSLSSICPLSMLLMMRMMGTRPAKPVWRSHRRAPRRTRA